MEPLVGLESLAQDTFSWESALVLALASELAYEEPRFVRDVVTRQWGFDDCQLLAGGGTECLLARTGPAVVVAFRGTTSSLADWLADLTLWSTPKSYGQVHAGFAGAYAAIAARLGAAIETLDPAPALIHLTGHSLGGAVATIAACELRARFPIADVYSFGQPRVGDAMTRMVVERHFADRFHRFVFDGDLVTRLPPGYVHVGQLHHFDGEGFLRPPLLEGLGGADEPPPLSDAEFQRVQDTAKKLREQARSAPPTAESVQQLEQRSLEGVLPWLSDHRLANYLLAIRQQIPRSPASGGGSESVYRTVELEQAARRGFQGLPPEGPAGDSGTQYPVQVRVRDRDWQPPPGATVHSRVGPVYSLSATPGEIAQMQHDERLLSVHLGRDLDLPAVEECSVSVPFIGADRLHGGPIQERGDQALVGLIDTGIDILHEAFLDAQGMSRIEVVWVQRDSTGRTPHQVDPQTYSQDYGTLYQAPDIQAFVNNDLVNGNQSTPSVLRDPGADPTTAYGHGTHVASIAAGRAVGSFAGGVAPEARLVVVVPHLKSTPPNPPSLGYSNSHQDALAFLAAYKRGRGLPMAVNVSLGMNAGAHDGMSPLEKVFDSITTKGSERGLVIVKSAGNERGHQGHACVQAAVGGVVTIEWDSDAVARPIDYFEFWYDKYDELSFVLIDPQGVRSDPVSDHGQRRVTFPTGGNDADLELTVHHPDNVDNLLVVRIVPVWNPIQAGTWTLEIQAVALGPGNGFVHGWVERSESRPVTFLPGVANDDMTLSIPGTADTVICVAATNVATPLRLHAASSHGPTRKNAHKPDVNAPGERITAARSNSTDHRAVVTLTGTSMAAPHVTGALALVLSARHKKTLVDPAKPQFNALELADMLRRSSRGFMRTHNKGYGYGGLDAAVLFREAELA